MDLKKEFTYNNDKIVLLVCDFYETTQIPKGMYSVKDNLALFPVANVPLIEFILTNFAEQNFKNVILAGSKIDSLLEHLQGTLFFDLLNIRILKGVGSSLGDIFREIDRLDLHFKDLIVMYANHYTNIPLNRLLRKHKKAKNKLLTLFTYKYDTNDNNVHVYGTHENDIIYYEKVSNNTLCTQDILAMAKDYNSIMIDTSNSGPNFAVVSNQVFRIFTDNFDYHSISDLIKGVLAANIWPGAFQLVRSEDFEIKGKIKESMPGATDKFDERFKSESSKQESNKRFYSREIITVLDYYKLNIELREQPSIMAVPFELVYVKGDIGQSREVHNSFIGERCCIDANLYNCVVWDNVHVKEDFSEHIVFSSNDRVNVFHLEATAEEQTNEPEKIERSHSFFDDINNYLRSCVTTAKFYNLDMGDVTKQISLMRIVWNASRREVIEAYAYFFVDILEADNLESTMSRASVFLCLLPDVVQCREDEELLMSSILDNLSETTFELRAQVFFNYAFLLVQDKIVSKSVIKPYNRMYNEGVL